LLVWLQPSKPVLLRAAIAVQLLQLLLIALRDGGRRPWLGQHATAAVAATPGSTYSIRAEPPRCGWCAKAG
jgi:hypothetical protein